MIKSRLHKCNIKAHDTNKIKIATVINDRKKRKRKEKKMREGKRDTRRHGG